MSAKERVLLPADVCPKRYQLTLRPDLRNLSFSGAETVEVEVRTATDRIVLHAAELEIRSAVLEQDGVSMAPERIELNEGDETVSVLLGRPLKPGSARLSFDFAGQLNDKLRGFYRAVYSVGGEQRVMAVTQFEPTSARRAFPCWDEPALKAVFDVTLVVPRDRLAISNMPPESTGEGPDGLKTVRFAPTPVMSTYLLAFIVGEFDWVEEQTQEGVPIRVYTPVGQREQGRFALAAACRTLSFFEQYFAIPYPLPKLDMIALPDFEAGAMENFGAVTYRETMILVDPEESSAATRQTVAIVVAHEIAHMWFGDVTSPSWWRDLWLNEGFASWAGNMAVHDLFPDWDMWTQFVAGDFSSGLGLDALENSHPVEVEVYDARQINEIFDAISYSKGASVIRMLAAFLGRETFRRGLQRYLKRHEFANATTEDLWHALEEESGQPVKQMMDTWTKQTGYPLVSVDMEQDELKLRQTRFSLNRTPDREAARRWSIPLGIRAEGAEDAYHVLEGDSATVPVSGTRGGWVKLNPDQTGFFRTNYSAALWERLEAAVATGELSATDRLGLESDAFAMARAGYIETPRALALASAYRQETDYTVWSDLSKNLGICDSLLCGQPAHEAFRTYAAQLHYPAFERLGWVSRRGEDHLTTLLRAKLIEALVRYGHPSVVAEALRRFDRDARGASMIEPDLRSAVYAAVVAHRGVDGYEAVLDIYRKASLHEEKVRALRVLGASSEPSLVLRALDFALSDEVRGQDTPLAVTGVSTNPLGREAAWDFLRDNWDELDARYGEGFIIARIVADTTANFHTLDRAEEVETFFALHPAPSADRAVRQSVERIRVNARWLLRDGKSIEGWLEAFRPDRG